MRTFIIELLRQNSSKKRFFLFALLLSSSFITYAARTEVFNESTDNNIEQFFQQSEEDEFAFNPEFDSEALLSGSESGLDMQVDEIRDLSEFFENVKRKVDAGDRKWALRELLSVWPNLSKMYSLGAMIAQLQLQEKLYKDVLLMTGSLKKLEPKNPAGWNMEAIAYDFLGESENAKKTFEHVLKIDSGNVNATLNLVNYLIKDNKLVQARIRYEEMIKKYPNNYQGLLSISDFEKKIGDVEKSKKYLQQAIDNHSDAARPKLLLAKLLYEQGKLEESLAINEPLLKEHEDNIYILEQVAIIKFMQNDYESAKHLLLSAIKVAPENAALHYNLGRTLLAQDKEDEAVQSLEKANSLQSGHGPTNLILAQLMAKKGEYKEAHTKLQEIEKKYPNSATIKQITGQVFLQQKRPDQAIKKYKEAFELNKSTNLVLLLAMAQQQADKVSESYTTLNAWLKDNPKDFQVRTALAQMQLDSNMLEEAKAHYQFIDKHFPKGAGAKNNIAWILALQGQFNNAEVVARKALKLAPNLTEVQDTLGYILYKTGKFEEAEQLLRKSLDKNVNNPSAALHLAEVLIATKQDQEAEELLLNIIKNNKKYMEIGRVKSLLTTLKK